MFYNVKYNIYNINTFKNDIIKKHELSLWACYLHSSVYAAWPTKCKSYQA